MSDWTPLQIGEHVGIVPGFPFDSKHFDDEEGTPLIRIRDLMAGETETNYNGRYDKTFLVEMGDILVGMDGDFNIARWKGGTALLNQRMLKIVDRHGGKIGSAFLYYWLGPFLIEVNNRTAATTVKHLSTYDISNAWIDAPPLPQQRKIAKILTTVDNLIEKTEALIAKYQAIKQGMMHDLFTRGVDEHGHLRPPYDEAPELYKESELGWIPKEWEVEAIESSQIELIDGDRGENYPKQDDFHDEGHCVFLNANNVTKDGFVFDSVQFITRERDECLGTGKFQRHDVVITTRGTVGNIAYYDESIPFADMRVNSGMIILRNNDVSMSSEFLYQSYRNYLFRREYERVVSGSAQPQLPARDLKKFRIVKPKQQEQALISERVNSIGRRLCAERHSLLKTKTLKTGLMQDLLTGKVRVKVDEGVADV